MTARHNAGTRRWWILIAVIAIVAIAWIVARPGARASVAIADARSGTMVAWIDERATTGLVRTYRITAPFDGRVKPITLRPGDTVRAGDVVARMEPTDLSHRVNEASAEIERLRAAIRENDDERLERTLISQIEAVLLSVDTAVQAAEERTRSTTARSELLTDERERMEGVFNQGGSTDIELRRARVAQISAEVEVREAFLTLRSSEAIQVAAKILPRFIEQVIEQKALSREIIEREIEQASSRLARLRGDLARAEMTIDTDGVILERHVSNLRAVRAGEVLLEIGRSEELEVEIEMLTDDASTIRVGGRVELVGRALDGRTVDARIDRVHPRGFKKISSLGVEEQRVLVIAKPDAESLRKIFDDNRRLGPGFRLRARVILDEVENALMVPRSAMFRAGDGRWQVLVARAGRARLTDVRVGLMNDDEAHITDGLTEGARVILAPPSSLHDGDRIRADN